MPILCAPLQACRQLGVISVTALKGVHAKIEIEGFTMADSIKDGDLARSKSGGPVMTVFRIFQDLAYCRWLDGKRLGGGVFELSSLVRVKQ